MSFKIVLNSSFFWNGYTCLSFYPAHYHEFKIGDYQNKRVEIITDIINKF